MTDATENDVPLFQKLRTDPTKTREGVWVRHPETDDEFLLRRLWCPEHVRAYAEALDEHERRTGEKVDVQAGGDKLAEVEAIALGTGIVVDWKLAGNPDRPYDAKSMAAALSDPELVDLRNWITMQADRRGNFRPDQLSGN